MLSQAGFHISLTTPLVTERDGGKRLQNSIKIGLNESGSGWILAGKPSDL